MIVEQSTSSSPDVAPMNPSYIHHPSILQGLQSQPQPSSVE